MTLAGRYRLDARLGAGGMGEVWRGEDMVLARTVAVKVLLPGRLDDPGFAVRFQGEARAMATVNHPGVVDVYDYGVTDVPGDGPTAYLVMKFVDGEPLDRLLTRLGRIGPEPAMELIAQAAAALHAVHARGIVHRDVKPGNLLVRSDGTLVLTDFGIARADSASRLTDAGMVLGTAAYCAPEQAEGQPVTPAVDVYALGVVAYECLAGRRPFDGESPVAIALQHIRDEPPPLPRDVPPAVRMVVERALLKDPARRWPDAAAMSDAARRSVLPDARQPAHPQFPHDAGAAPAGLDLGGPAPGGYSPATGGYSPATGGYSPATGGYSPATGGYSPATGGYGPATGGYASSDYPTQADRSYGAEAWEDRPVPPETATAATTPGPRGSRRRKSRKAPIAAGAAGLAVFAGLAALGINALAASGDEQAGPSTSPLIYETDTPTIGPSTPRPRRSKTPTPTAQPSQPAVVPRSPSPSPSPSATPTPSPSPSPSPSDEPMEKVPSVIGLTEEKATAKLRSLGFKVRVSSAGGDGMCTKVTAQDPKGGEEAPEGATLKIAVTKIACTAPSPSPSPSLSPPATPDASPSPH
ncbi:serine/threonine protein kinase [Microtetraspora fusca]|uniref:serine/threonine protein kinase n=1 Tax=Microtetraspora fusca TaxID=1997 RepID=UPI001FE22871|nr:serine/threonine protein kinase [Microtetraspora fusca]